MPAELQAKKIESVRILGVRIDRVNSADATLFVENCLCAGGFHQIATVNPEFVVKAQTHQEFRAVLDRCALNLPDGVGILWAARRLGLPITERVAGQEMVDSISALAARCGYRIFLLGARDGVAERAAEELKRRYPALGIAGCFAGSPNPEFDQELAERIRASGARVLFVAYGPPKQELWIARNSARLGAGIAMGVGGTFDTLAGLVPRAPRWVRDAGFEWTFRLFREPRRLRRQMSIPYFMWLVMTKEKRHSKA